MIRLRHAVAAVLAVLAVAALVVASGLVPVAASSGHWWITDRFLHFAMGRSVVTHSLMVATPPLDDPALVVRGAGHYELACASCHGSPELERQPVAQGMTPAPPYLPPRVAQWRPRELFWIVKHGVKFTGMPAWPSQVRDDEVWAMVAFLERFPDLDAAAYRRLAFGDATMPGSTAAQPGIVASAVAICARCHGPDGLGRDGSSPRLAAQRPAYLRGALEAYARGARRSGIMQPVAAGLSVETMRVLAEHYAALPARAAVAEADPAAVARGRVIAHDGVRTQRLPPCSACHGPNPRRRNPAYPVLAGQDAAYLVLQLELLQTNARGGSPYVRLMRPIAARLAPGQIRDVAAYYASLAPDGDD